MILPKTEQAHTLKKQGAESHEQGRRMGMDTEGTTRVAGTPQRRHSSQLKAKGALEALKGQKTLNELAREFGVQPVQIA